jgi:hypothetical protein
MTSTEWQQISCDERESLVDAFGRSFNGFADHTGIGPISSRTDPDGVYGRPEVFTEWGYREDGRPVLRDHRYPGTDEPCEHFRHVDVIVPTAPASTR